MLQLVVPIVPERWDEKNEKFIEAQTKVIQLEHSLVSISKWESKWCKPFISSFSNRQVTDEETMDYIKDMTVTQNVGPDVYNHLTQKNIDDVVKYINAPMTATVFYENKNEKKNRETVTAELIYYWMISLQIPVEFQKWHLNRLLTLIRVCNIKNQPPKKRSGRELMFRNTALNAARRQQLNTRG